MQWAAQRGASPALLEDIRLAVNGVRREVGGIQLVGLKSLDPDRVWRLLGGKPSVPLTVPQLSATLFRLAGTGLFARVAPTLRLDDGSSTMEIALEEQPFVRNIVVNGLTETSAADVMNQLLATSPPATVAATSDQCAIPNPPRDWLARLEGSEFKPGLVLGGIPEALRPVITWFIDEGYWMASLSAQLMPDGTLIIDVEEGRLEQLEITGIDEHVEPSVRQALGLKRGQVFLRSDLADGLSQVRRTFPFLTHRVDLPPSPAPPGVSQSAGPDGVVRFDLTRAPPAAPVPDYRSRHGKLLRTRVKWPSWHGHGDDDGGGFSEIDGRKLKIHFQANLFKLDADFTNIIRHTQVTNFAPGASFTGWLLDPGDRAHLALDLELSVGRGPVHWVVGPRVQIPALSIAELGLHVYGMNDTGDRWRISAIDSYLHSIFFNRPDSEYFRRTGFSPFITFHFSDRLTLGGEYRLDDYESLPRLNHVFKVFNGREAPQPNPEITVGKMGSLVLRLEWSTVRASLRRVGNWSRYVETSIVDRDWDEDGASQFRTVNTVEVADPSLGGEGFRFTRVISDNVLYLRAGHRHGLKFRLRGSGGSHLPLQKQEALGGWSALRGYDFKEFRGDFSLLGSAEYRFGWLGMFTDVGAVHQPVGWTQPLLGLGLALHVGAGAHLAAAWRTDSKARAAPEVEFFFVRSF